MSNVDDLCSAIERLGTIQDAVTLLRSNPEFRDISMSTIFRWKNAKAPLRASLNARIGRVAALLRGVSDEAKKHKSKALSTLVEDIEKTQKELGRKIQRLKKLLK